MRKETVDKLKRFALFSKAEGPSSLDADKRELTAVVSTDDVDRDGEIVEPSAFEDKIDTFLANPVFLWMHEARNPPIGRALDVRIGKHDIEADLKFRPEGESELADDIFTLFADGTLRMFSIGFRVFEMVFSENEETGDSKPPRITSGELLEISAVSIPANPNVGAKAQRLKSLAYQERRPAPEKVIEKIIYSPVTKEQAIERAIDEINTIRRRTLRGETISDEAMGWIRKMQLALAGIDVQEDDGLQELHDQLLGVQATLGTMTAETH